MDVHILGAIIASIPAISFWLSWPRRPWAAYLVSVAVLIFWLVGFAVVEDADRPLWMAVGAWSMFGGLYASYVATRNVGDYKSLEAMIRDRGQRKADLQKALQGAKVKGARTEGQQREVMALYGMVKGLSESLSWEEVRPKLENAVQQYLGLDEFALYVADMRAQSEFHPLVIRYLTQSVGGNWDTLVRCFQEQNVNMGEPNFVQTPEKAVAAPIREAEEVMGYFYGRVPPGAEPQALLRKVSGFVEEIAFAFRRVKLFQEMERLSQIDGLTGLYRRGMFDTRLQEEVIRARTFKTTLCVLLTDIDHFKKLNDTYGHPFGDQVLRRVGEVLKASVYETDFVARYGGEEFVVILPRADAVGVIRKAQAVRMAVEREVFQLGMQTIRVTMSIGVAHFPRDGETPDALVHQADQALYHAKESGRNRVVDIAEVPGKQIHG